MSAKKIIMICFIWSLIFVASTSARELIKNGEFDDSFTNWTDWKISDAVNYVKSIDKTGVLSGLNSAKFDFITGSDTDWHMQFHYAAFATQKTANYYVSFKAGFDGIVESVILPATIRDPLTNVDPIIMQYNADLPLIPHAAFETFQFVYAADTSLASTQLNFFLGGHDDVLFWIDAVSIIEEGPFWLNTPFENMDDAVEVKCNVYPDSAFKGLVGLCQGEASSEDDLVCGLYFEPGGTLKVLNGTVLQADEPIEYEMDTRISVTVLANISKQRYDVKVKPSGSSEKTLATGYAFKKPVSSLNHIVTNTNINPDDGGRPMTSLRIAGIETAAKTVVEKTRKLPTQADLIQNYPNPFNPATTIEFSLAVPEHVSIDIFNTAGAHVKNVIKQSCPAGRSEIHWNATDKTGRKVPSGVYYVRLKSDRIHQVHKMMLLR
ncbi:T9SS type A sorting domain-containing protein [candidate division KSB1 bacterium]|nr:T9SS type A sorting domain-containing protein [candidate division KSB1 bacterium]